MAFRVDQSVSMRGPPAPLRRSLGLGLGPVFESSWTGTVTTSLTRKVRDCDIQVHGKFSAP
jgi:hypothetical protein